MKNTALLCAVAALCIAACAGSPKKNSNDGDSVFRKMAAKLSSAENRLPGKTVAVYGFDVIGRPNDNFARYATEKLTHALVDAGRLQVVERSRIDEVLKEQRFTLTGMVDANTAARIGKILAVDAVIIGTINVTESESEFIARAIMSDRAIILVSANERLRARTVVKKEHVVPDRKTDGGAEPDIKTPVGSDTRFIVAKEVYLSGEQITVRYSGMSGSQYDWITLVEAPVPDTSYGEWFYTNGNISGTHTFNAVGPGNYEVRAYFDWPAGGYVVRQRLKIPVK